jgi:hypothetical protein
MTTANRISSDEDYQRATQRLEELRRNPAAAGTQQEVRELTERVEAYKRENPNAAAGGASGTDPQGSAAGNPAAASPAGTSPKNR